MTVFPNSYFNGNFSIEYGKDETDKKISIFNQYHECFQ